MSAVQLKFDEAAWAKRALALQVQVQPIGHGEIIVVMNDDPEDGVQEPFFIGEAAALYDTKAGEIGIAYIWVLGDQETLLVNCTTTTPFLTHYQVRAGQGWLEPI